MKQIFPLALLATLTGCASIISGTTQDVELNAAAGTSFAIKP